jgi:hypothetical protein
MARIQSAEQGSHIYTLIRPSTAWFNIPITSESVLAPIPGTADADAISRFGRIHCHQNMYITVVHFHYDHPAGSGTYSIELWRRRNNQNLLIASISTDGSSGDFGTYNFSFVDESYRNLNSSDYLLMQVTSVMTGSGSKKAAGYVDVHYSDVIKYTQP